MIATIVCGLFLILAIVLIILSVINFGEPLVIGFVLGGATLLILAVSLCNGYIPYHSDILKKKEDLIVLYQNCPCKSHIRDIIYHNNKVENGNNLWCRFTIEDRSEYKINITELLKGVENG